jgi:hypothetical protein
VCVGTHTTNCNLHSSEELRHQDDAQQTVKRRTRSHRLQATTKCVVTCALKLSSTQYTTKSSFELCFATSAIEYLCCFSDCTASETVISLMTQSTRVSFALFNHSQERSSKFKQQSQEKNKPMLLVWRRYRHSMILVQFIGQIQAQSMLSAQFDALNGTLNALGSYDRVVCRLT